jgi:hypothetical protein
VKLFSEKTVEYIDAGETVSRRYMSFLYKTAENVRDMTLENGGSRIIIHTASKQIPLDTIFKKFL